MLFWRRIIRNYFTFNSRERRAVYTLTILLFCLIAVHAVMRFYPRENPNLQIKYLESIANINPDRTQISEDVDEKNAKNYEDILWKNFDPNTAGFTELVSLGLDSSIATRMIKYRNKGGKFRGVKDVLKVYCIDKDWVSNAVEHMNFPVDKNPSLKGESKWVDWDTVSKPDISSSKKISVVELNTIDSAKLVEIPWVGPFTAGEIVEMRKRYGGFRSYDQLVDIYRISDQAIENIMRYTTLDTTLMTKINLNSCTLKQLGRHPHITWKHAKIILNYREQHGPYQSTKGILQTSVISDSLYSKIAPYLSVQ